MERTTTTEKPKKRATRQRRDAAAAREAILDATERRLVAAGPSGIRLQEVAADAGVSHPTVLHHFGSREALVKAVIARSIEAIHASLVEAIASSGGDERGLAAMLNAVAEALSGGHARVVMWLALEGEGVGDAGVTLANVVDAAHRVRRAKPCKGRPPTREDTASTVVLATLALLGSAVLGPAVLENAGLPGGPAGEARFRRWLARLLVEHLDPPA